MSVFGVVSQGATVRRKIPEQFVPPYFQHLRQSFIERKQRLLIIGGIAL
jgi:hypothetical protein